MRYFFDWRIEANLTWQADSLWHKLCVNPEAEIFSGGKALDSLPARRIRGHESPRFEESLIAAMLRSSFYPGRPSGVTHLETHISHLFFAGDLVYKVKKPVRFSFLNYSTLRRRHYFLHEELRLNRRLAPSLYLGVLPISYGAGGWLLGSDVQPVEYALVMRRLPERRMLPFLLERGLVTPHMTQTLAETLASFHAAAATGGEIDASGRPQAIQKVWAENLADIHPFTGPLLDRETFEALQNFGQLSLVQHEDLFMRRLHEGRIREVHGDLHCEHICFAPEGIQIFDCIEFSRRLRCCDVASEAAFLLMDLELRGGAEPARTFLDRYLELTGDLELPVLLPFYKCYRALVRGKAETLRSAAISPQASRYFELAYRITWEELKPFVILICGPTGSGKSTVARGLSERLGLPVISSDATRKALAGVSQRQDAAPYEAGIYSPSMTERTYAKMFEEAEGLVSKGQGVILDATFQRRAHREALLGLAARHRVSLAVIHCRGSEDVIRERLRRRQEEGLDLSDGRWEVYVRQKASFEPLREIPSERCLTLDTEAPATALVHRAERFLLSILKKRS